MDSRQSLAAAQKAVERCLTLARLSEEEGRTTRTFLSPPMREAHNLLRGWMESAGLAVTVDPIGNLRGLLDGAARGSPRLLIGSHLDTVPGAGAFDGVLGVMLGLALVEALGEAQARQRAASIEATRPGIGIGVLAFSEEEGVRFGVPFLGSKAVTGTLDSRILERQDAHGVTVAQAIRHFGLNPDRLEEAKFYDGALGYVEFHIEQGPVLDSMGLPVGVVDGIAGQTRVEAAFRGQTNHAGTTPMHLRRDALPAAAEWILDVEREASATAGLVATVGHIRAVPGASNVIPGEARVTLDVRHADDSVRTAAVARLHDRARILAKRRRLELTWELRLDQSAVACDGRLTDSMMKSVESAGYPIHRMVSGAGHDAMIMASRMPAAMLFIRSPEGISHDSAESVRIDDVAASLRVGWHFLKQVALHHASTGTD
jgi:allantoate deiminase